MASANTSAGLMHDFFFYSLKSGYSSAFLDSHQSCAAMCFKVFCLGLSYMQPLFNGFCCMQTCIHLVERVSVWLQTVNKLVNQGELASMLRRIKTESQFASVLTCHFLLETLKCRHKHTHSRSFIVALQNPKALRSI